MPGKRISILIVEDQIALEGRPLAYWLEKNGYRVIAISSTAKDAVETALREHPVVVLMDVELEDDEGRKDRLGGLRAARQIKEATESEVVFLTGTLAEPDVLAAAQKTPGAEFLIKPVPYAQLDASLQAMTAKSVIRAKEAKDRFDVFLSYNSQDRAAVEKIAKRLIAVGIRPWLDRWQLPPGATVMDALGKVINTVPCAALCFGPGDVGKWHIMEIRAYLERWASGQARMIPVLLPGSGQPPELPTFLGQTVWADMRLWEGQNDDGLYRLVCGIVNRPPGNGPAKKFSARDVVRWQGLGL